MSDNAMLKGQLVTVPSNPSITELLTLSLPAKMSVQMKEKSTMDVKLGDHLIHRDSGKNQGRLEIVG